MKHRYNLLCAAVLATVLARLLAPGARPCASPTRATALSMDPHSLNESLQLSVTGNVYEAWSAATRT